MPKLLALNIKVFPDALDFFGDELLVGASQNSAGATKTENPMGLYGFLKGTARYLGTQSPGEDGSGGTSILGHSITSIYAISTNEFLVAWSKDLTYGIDYYGPANSRITSYGAYLHSELFLIGSDRLLETIEYFDFYLSKPLVSGDGIRLSYRTGNSGDFTTIATMDFATHGAVNTWSFRFSIPKAKILQFKVEMTATSTTTPELIMIAIS